MFLGSSMKNKRKLVVDCDDEMLSPAVLMDDSAQSSRVIESEGKVGKRKKSKTQGM